MKSIIKFEDVSFSYQKQQSTIENVSFAVNENESIALIGKNGSGKSTIAKLIDGLLIPDSGKIMVAGQELQAKNISQIRQKIGIVFQNPEDQIIGATVAEDVAFGLENQNMDADLMQNRVSTALKAVGIYEKRDVNPQQLSGGQKQKVSLARAIALNSQILILDEATSMLDPTAKHDIMKTIGKLRSDYQLTIINITHDMENLVNTDRVLAMKAGKLVFNGKSDELFATRNLLKELEIETPFTEQVKQQLQAKGLEFPNQYLNEEELSQWITKLF
ncbi:energy-coupling factor transporter ATPase [Fructilactobacillus vespulae]|uniref:energy-coupling factor transporter ATPase n=1 Tax=Fructilactobacillus vespulae TaxID=1249630 RepID=UPI0039B4328B